ncbi:MAG: hypothetical protein ACTHZ9_03360 [Leucobacter sp.]
MPVNDDNPPTEVPVEEMPLEQQISYWRNEAGKWKTLSRKHEKRWRRGDFAPPPNLNGPTRVPRKQVGDNSLTGKRAQTLARYRTK